MVLLKYFKTEKRGPPLPDPFGSLNQHLRSSSIEEANKEVTAILVILPSIIQTLHFDYVLSVRVKLYSNLRTL